MIIDFLNKNYESIVSQFTVVFVTWIIVILAIGIDLYFGIKKSKKLGVFKTHSFGLRRTSEKTVQYLGFMFFMLFGDFLNPIWAYFNLFQLPLLSIFGAIVLVYTEWKSVKENADEKFRIAIKNNPSEIIQFIRENKDLIEELKNKKE
ncbi:holin [Flavobacterium sp. NKUCC04_CG]|uniref:holin n=1 Tax=Flavobacterium sp. NKUCC04_CG TaxID=2842121 RepID=UPI001C5B3C28|nr:holin [Flavobacterium sp. NKUCC04_CG]MBW3520419.1 holin [Flavobacterium sp. NKUCC04_CG]